VSPAPAGSLSPFLARFGPDRYIITLNETRAVVVEGHMPFLLRCYIFIIPSSIRVRQR